MLTPVFNSASDFKKLDEHCKSIEKSLGGSPAKANRLFYFALPPTVFAVSAASINTSARASNGGWARCFMMKYQALFHCFCDHVHYPKYNHDHLFHIHIRWTRAIIEKVTFCCLCDEFACLTLWKPFGSNSASYEELSRSLSASLTEDEMYGAITLFIAFHDGFSYVNCRYCY